MSERNFQHGEWLNETDANHRIAELEAKLNQAQTNDEIWRKNHRRQLHRAEKAEAENAKLRETVEHQRDMMSRACHSCVADFSRKAADLNIEHKIG